MRKCGGYVKRVTNGKQASMFGTNSVRFVDRGTAVEAYLTKDGRKHSAASVTNEEEAAAMMKAHELIANAEYVFSSKHDPHSERGKNIPPDTVWDYFEAVAEFGTVTMPVRFTLRDITDDVREQLYKIGINEKEVSPNNRAPKKARLVDRGETSFKKSIAESLEKSKGEFQMWDEVETTDKLRK